MLISFCNTIYLKGSFLIFPYVAVFITKADSCFVSVSGHHGRRNETNRPINSWQSLRKQLALGVHGCRAWATQRIANLNNDFLLRSIFCWFTLIIEKIDPYNRFSSLILANTYNTLNSQMQIILTNLHFHGGI